MIFLRVGRSRDEHGCTSQGPYDLIDTPDVRRPTRDGFVLGPVLEKQGTATLRTISLPSGENLVGERRT